jgi:hypothetical protein
LYLTKLGHKLTYPNSGIDGIARCTPTTLHTLISILQLQHIAMADTTTPAPSANTSKKQSHNFGPEEDKQLAKSWLLISTDPIRSNNQSKEQFWSSVVNDFNIFTGGPSREALGLQSRQIKMYFSP